MGAAAVEEEAATTPAPEPVSFIINADFKIAGAAKKCQKLFFVTVSALSCLTSKLLLLRALPMLKVLQLLTKKIPMTTDGTWIIQCGQDGILKALAASQVRSLSAVISKRSLSAKHVHVEQCLYQDKEEN